MSSMSHPLIPDLSDFQSAFGCDGNIDQDLFLTCIFKDRNNQKASLVFGLLDSSFSMSIMASETEIIKIYDEFLEKVSIKTNDQMIEIFLGNKDERQKLFFKVWPSFTVSIIRMK